MQINRYLYILYSEMLYDYDVASRQLLIISVTLKGIKT